MELQRANGLWPFPHSPSSLRTAPVAPVLRRQKHRVLTSGRLRSKAGRNARDSSVSLGDKRERRKGRKIRGIRRIGKGMRRNGKRKMGEREMKGKQKVR